MLNKIKKLNESVMMDFLLLFFLSGSVIPPRRSLDYSKMKIRNYDAAFYLGSPRTTVLTYLGIYLKQKFSCLPKTTKPFTSASLEPLYYVCPFEVMN